MAIYKDLSEVERAFAGLKKCVETRPSITVRRHGGKGAFIVSLAFLLNRALEKNSSPQAGTSPPRKLGER